MTVVKVTNTQQVLVKEISRQLVKVIVPSQTATVKVVVAGPQGPPGPSGAAYTYTQQTPSLTWTINHNLGTKPSVELLNAGSQEIEGDVVHTSSNQVVVSFNTAIAGTARLV